MFFKLNKVVLEIIYLPLFQFTTGSQLPRKILQIDKVDWCVAICFGVMNNSIYPSLSSIIEN